MKVLGIITLVLVGIILVVMFSRRVYAWMEARTSREYTRQVKAMWRKNWNGNEADRIPALERTLYSLVAHQYPGEMILEAQIMLDYELRKAVKAKNESSLIQPEVRRFRVSNGQKKVTVTEVKS